MSNDDQDLKLGQLTRRKNELEKNIEFIKSVLQNNAELLDRIVKRLNMIVREQSVNPEQLEFRQNRTVITHEDVISNCPSSEGLLETVRDLKAKKTELAEINSELKGYLK